MVRGAALYRGRNDVLRFPHRVFLGFGFDRLRLCGGTALDFVEERVLEFRRRFFSGHAGDSFQLALHDLLRIVQFRLDGFQPLAVFLDALLRLFDFRELLVEGVLFLVEVVLLAVDGVFFLQQPVLRPLPVRPAFLGLALEFRAEFVLLFLGFQKAVFANGFRFQSGFFQDPCRFSFCQADFVLRIQSVCNQPDRRADD